MCLYTALMQMVGYLNHFHREDAIISDRVEPTLPIDGVQSSFLKQQIQIKICMEDLETTTIGSF